VTVEEKEEEKKPERVVGMTLLVYFVTDMSCVSFYIYDDRD
jgi:hypothetical protein